MSVECYRLNEKNKWELTPYYLQETVSSPTELLVKFTSVSFQCSLASIYEDVMFPEES